MIRRLWDTAIGRATLVLRSLRKGGPDDTLAQVVRFGLVGVANTLVYYVLYRLLLATGLSYVPSHLMAWAVSVVFSYFANCLFTYRVKPTWRRFFAFPVTTLANVAFTTLGSIMLVSLFSADQRYVTLVMGILAIPLTFLITRAVLVGSDQRRDWRGLGRSATAPLLAAGTAVAINLSVAASLGQTPFGNAARAVGDYGPQYLPFHIYLHDVLSGATQGDMLFNWAWGAGSGMLPLYATYLSGPWTLLVGLFPLKWMDAAILAVSLVRIGLAAGAMALLLQILRPRGPRVAAVLLAVGYGASSWVMQLGMITPQWLDGLLAFPLLCLAGVVTVRRGTVLLPVFLVGLCWWTNYYSVMMATIGSAIFFLGWVVATKAPLWRSLLAFALRGLLGVASAAWLLWPTLLAVREAAPAYAPVPPSTLPREALSLFGFNGDLASAPFLFVGSFTLVAAIATIAAKDTTWRARLSWAAMAALPVGLLQWRPVVLLFNGFDDPNGNAFRWSFVVTGLLVIAGWHALGGEGWRASVASWLSWPQLALAAAVLAVLAAGAGSAAARAEEQVNPLWWAGTAATLALLLLLKLIGDRWAAARLVALAALVLLELALSGIDAIPRAWSGYGPSAPYVRTSAAEREVGRLTTEASQWPTYRASIPLGGDRAWWTIDNDPMRFNLPGVTMYSSLLPAQVEQDMQGLGLTVYYRGVRDRPGILPDTVWSVGARYDLDTDQLRTRDMFPLVRALPPLDAPADGDLGRWTALLGEGVVTAAEVSAAWEDGEPIDPSALTAPTGNHSRVRYTATCSAGSLSLRTPDLNDAPVAVDSPSGSVSAPANWGWLDNAAPAATTAAIEHAALDTTTPLVQFFCVDDQRLADNVAATAIPEITVSTHGLHAAFSEPVTGDVVIATPAQPGWTCTADGRPAVVGDRAGQLAVATDGAREIDCGYLPKGLPVGLGVSALALAGAVVLVFLNSRRRAPESNGAETAPAA